MQNIAKTDINTPGSTSQQERRQERPLKAARNHRQACLNAETKEQRQAKLEVDRGTTEEHRGTNQEIILSQEYYQHQFDFELVQDGDRRPLLARHNLSKRFIHN